MKKILVPIDFTSASRNAVKYAASLAKVFDSEIFLLHVYREFLPITQGPEPWTITVSKSHVESEKQVNREIENISKTYSVQVKGEVRNGSKAGSIMEVAEEWGADMVVMGMKSRQNKIFGSTVLKIIRRTTIPVLIIPEEVPFSPLKNIVLAVDFNEMARRASFQPLQEVVEKFDSVLRVLHVEEKNTELKASEVAPKLQLGAALGKFTYVYEKLECDDVEQGIRSFLENHPGDLLVMVAHHHTILERIFGLVLTRSLSFLTKLPLLILK